MSLRSFITDELLLEGGRALKNTSGIKQKHVSALLADLIPKIAIELRLSPTQILLIGSANKKPKPDDMSGDIDLAVQTADLKRVKHAISMLGNSFRAMPAINVYSFDAAHPDGTVQIDLMPVTNLKLAAWAFYSAKSDLELGLKGSHRNEVLFALAKHINRIDAGTEGERYKLDLSRGLYRVKQTKRGKRGIIKSWSTVSKILLTDDPDQICKRLFGYPVPAQAVLSFSDAMVALNDSRFLYPHLKPQIIETLIAGLRRKELLLPLGFS